MVRLHPQPCCPKARETPMFKYSLHAAICLSAQSSKRRQVLNSPPSVKSPQSNSTSVMSVGNMPTLLKHPNKPSKVIQVECVISKKFHSLGTFVPIHCQLQPRTPSGSLSHHTIIHKSLRCTLPHPMSHTKGERTPPKSLGPHSAHSY
jgi:hypothetical protein